MMSPESIYRRFKALPGSDQIASEFAIHWLMETILAWEPESVLEIGSGIGTLTFTAFAATRKPLRYAFVEDNQFCLWALQKNLPHAWRQMTNRTGGAGCVLPGPVDLVIVDGEAGRATLDWLTAKPRQVVFVEGNRRGQRDEIECAAWAAGRPLARLHLRPSDGSKGFWLYAFDVPRALRIALWLLTWTNWFWVGIQHYPRQILGWPAFAGKKRRSQ